MDYSSSRNIYLIGFMGSGKSTVGPLLAQRLDFRFIDLDQLIEQESGQKIAEIFAKCGEDHFRSLETEALTRLASVQKQVIALGGGAFIEKKNRELLHQSGVSVWLKISLKEAVRRCRKEPERPLARDESQFQALYKQRLAIYRQAEIHIETEGRDPEAICDLILQKFGRLC